MTAGFHGISSVPPYKCGDGTFVKPREILSEPFRIYHLYVKSTI
jgi:hypothetical protein